MASLENTICHQIVQLIVWGLVSLTQHWVCKVPTSCVLLSFRGCILFPRVDMPQYLPLLWMDICGHSSLGLIQTMLLWIFLSLYPVHTGACFSAHGIDAHSTFWNNSELFSEVVVPTHTPHRVCERACFFTSSLTPRGCQETFNWARLYFFQAGPAFLPTAAQGQAGICRAACLCSPRPQPIWEGPPRTKWLPGKCLEAAALSPSSWLLICTQGSYLLPLQFIPPSDPISFLSSKNSSKSLKISGPLMKF